MGRVRRSVVKATAVRLCNPVTPHQAETVNSYFPFCCNGVDAPVPEVLQHWAGQWVIYNNAKVWLMEQTMTLCLHLTGHRQVSVQVCDRFSGYLCVCVCLCVSLCVGPVLFGSNVLCLLCVYTGSLTPTTQQTRERYRGVVKERHRERWGGGWMWFEWEKWDVTLYMQSQLAVVQVTLLIYVQLTISQQITSHSPWHLFWLYDQGVFNGVLYGVLQSINQILIHLYLFSICKRVSWFLLLLP